MNTAGEAKAAAGSRKPEPPVMLSFDRVSYRFPSDGADFIDRLSFQVQAGSFVSLIGASGCGKSTIFRLITRLLQPRSGVIAVRGRPVAEQKSYCGYMPQKDLLFPWRTVGENLRLPLEIRGGFSRQEAAARVEAALADVGLAGCRDKYPGELSGGMRQRAAFARTTLTDCSLLLLDEPFSALDFLTRVSLQEWLLDQWQRRGSTILFITHDVEEAIFLSGTVLAVTESPLRQLVSLRVPAAYPRTRACLDRPEMLKLKEDLLELLRKPVLP